MLLICAVFTVTQNALPAHRVLGDADASGAEGVHGRQIFQLFNGRVVSGPLLRHFSRAQTARGGGGGVESGSEEAGHRTEGVWRGTSWSRPPPTKPGDKRIGEGGDTTTAGSQTWSGGSGGGLGTGVEGGGTQRSRSGQGRGKVGHGQLVAMVEMAPISEEGSKWLDPPQTPPPQRHGPVRRGGRRSGRGQSESLGGKKKKI